MSFKTRAICWAIFFLVTTCCSQHNLSDKKNQEIQEIQIQSPYQNLKIYKENDQWRGRFLPIHPNETTAAESSFRSYPFENDAIENLIDEFSKRPETKLKSLADDDVTWKIKTLSDEKKWIISKEDPLRRLVLKASTDWRSKKIWNENSSQVEEITFLRSNPPLTLIQNENEQWLWKQKPQSPLNQDLANSLARKLSRLKAQSVGERTSKKEANLDPPIAEILVKMRGQKLPFRVLLGKQKEQNLYYVEVEGIPDWIDEIFTVNQETAEKLNTKASDLLH